MVEAKNPTKQISTHESYSSRIMLLRQLMYQTETDHDLEVAASIDTIRCCTRQPEVEGESNHHQTRGGWLFIGALDPLEEM